MAAKIIDDHIRYRLTNEALWEADIASGCKRVDGSNYKSFTSRFFARLVRHGAKTIQFVAVQEPLRERWGCPK